MVDENMLQLCFSRQFWSSISRTDYMALRLGFITVSIILLSQHKCNLHKKWIVIFPFIVYFSGVL